MIIDAYFQNLLCQEHDAQLFQPHYHFNMSQAHVNYKHVPHASVISFKFVTSKFHQEVIVVTHFMAMLTCLAV